MLSITKSFTFQAAHRLFRRDLTEAENQDIYGACTRMHGHAYRLQVTLTGTPDPNGLILNFTALKKIVVREILDRYDHTDLTELAEYRDRPPTVENMVDYVFAVLDRILSCDRYSLSVVRIYESDNSWAEKRRHA